MSFILIYGSLRPLGSIGMRFLASITAKRQEKMNKTNKELNKSEEHLCIYCAYIIPFHLAISQFS